MAGKIISDAIESRLESLEIRSAYQEDMIEHLNEALGQQHLEIQQLNKQLDLVSTILRQLKNEVEADIKRPSEEVPPPHY